jgi:methylthioribose-1-phosphate isomerase
MPAPDGTHPGGVETLRFRDGVLELIDQRVLPLEFRFVRASSAAEVIDAIATMVVRGAPAIGCTAAYGVALEARRLAQLSRPEFDEQLNSAFDGLARSRPTAVNLCWALDRMREAIAARPGAAPSELAPALLELAHEIRAQDIAANQAMGALGARLLRDGSTVLTHCNAGALATAGHGTALGVIRSAVAAGKRLRVFADETRPFLQGARLTAWELLQDGIDVTLISDNMAGHFMQQGEIDAVIVGADRVASNGDVANKIGTYMVAVLARQHGIPFYVAAPLSTIDASIASGQDIVIEERGASEVTGFGGVRWAPEGVRVRNPAFDVTPAEFISALVTERGVVERPDRESIARLLASA